MITLTEAKLRCPDFSPANIAWNGINETYIFNCPTHGEFSETFRMRETGRGCQQCRGEFKVHGRKEYAKLKAVTAVVAVVVREMRNRESASAEWLKTQADILEAVIG